MVNLIYKKNDGWYFSGFGIEYGPFETEDEAEFEYELWQDSWEWL